MKLLSILIAGHVLSALVLAAPTDEDALYQDTPYIKKLLRQAKAAEIESFLDQKTDSCKDFYTFSCGNYKRINSALSSQMDSTGLFETLTKGLNRKILKILSTPHDAHDTPDYIQVKHFYESCLRITELNYNESRELSENAARALFALHQEVLRQEPGQYDLPTIRKRQVL
ncbi:endothelin-converting enzyme homolog [Drosophila santomea]|uniref:endothelin-converting enzyme homolog n=1 Tax=Drosophila santomea TaxID=129105 RepID=UPI001954057F|nr:endothelin-converting enzyme homolog [Drosophila santomea]